jgi:hypothetical protein
MLCQGKRNIVSPEGQQPVGFFLAVLVDAQVDPGSHGVDVAGDAAGWIKGFGIGQVVYEAYKIPCCFICIGSCTLLNIFPAVLALFYK